jgi:hypothetical protein
MPFNNLVRYEKYRPESRIQGARASALQAVAHLLQPLPGLSLAHRRELLSIALWKWTEASGIPPYAKFNLQFATSGALEKSIPMKINHEHVWRRKWIIDQLLQGGRTWNEAQLGDFLESCGVACVVTVEEHGRLAAISGQGWQRYRQAGIEVFDLQEPGPLDLGDLFEAEPGDESADAELEPILEPEEPTENALEPAHQTVGVAGPSVNEALDDLAGPKAALLKILVRMAELSGAVSVVGTTKNPDRPVGAYARVHDTTIEEPTRAAAYIHWSGKVSLGLVADDLPEALLAESCVTTAKHSTYGIQSQVSDAESLYVTEELLVLALEKLRESFAA